MTLREIEPSVMDAGGQTTAEDHRLRAPDQSAGHNSDGDRYENAGAGIAHSQVADLPWVGDPTPSEPAMMSVTSSPRSRARGAARKASVIHHAPGGSNLSDQPNVVAKTAHLLANPDGGPSARDPQGSVAAVTPFDWALTEPNALQAVPGQDGGHPGSEDLSTPAAIHLSEPAARALKTKAVVRARGSAHTARGAPPLPGAPNLSDPANVPVYPIVRTPERGGGLGSSVSQSGYAPAKKSRRAVHAAQPISDLPDEGDGQPRNEDQPPTAVAKKSRKPKALLRPKVVVVSEGDGQLIADTPTSSAVATIVDLWRQRQQLRKTQASLGLQAQAMCRRYVAGDKEAAQKAWAAIQKGKGDPDLAMIVQPYIEGGAPFERNAHLLEKQLAKLVRTLPIWTWAKDVRGLGELSVAGLVGEASGNIGDFKSVSAVWKRMGLAVIGGERQRRVATAEAALLHGYAPQRRAFAYVISCNLMKSQGSEGKYRAIYDRRKAYELAREIEVKGVMEPLTKAHAHNRALRVMVKEMLKDMWAADRRLRRIADEEALAA